ncbi:hypothetical protein HGA91_05355 [candidate division WWE3 bacterium]|nr:hypothetical protein [candidate division WWE3 bacterium]
MDPDVVRNTLVTEEWFLRRFEQHQVLLDNIERIVELIRSLWTESCAMFDDHEVVALTWHSLLYELTQNPSEFQLTLKLTVADMPMVPRAMFAVGISGFTRWYRGLRTDPEVVQIEFRNQVILRTLLHLYNFLLRTMEDPINVQLIDQIQVAVEDRTSEMPGDWRIRLDEGIRFSIIEVFVMNTVYPLVAAGKFMIG